VILSANNNGTVVGDGSEDIFHGRMIMIDPFLDDELKLDTLF
jgi:hypothetical protein